MVNCMDFLWEREAYDREIQCLLISLFSQWRADEHSVVLFRDSLEMFADLSGLHANISKSQLILSKSAFPIRQQLLMILGFQEGALRVRYLGLPLISSQLTTDDCRLLLTKVDEKLNGWGSLKLSYAARVQLLKSVISTLNVYWAMAFILPKGVIQAIEARMRKFLWQGGTRTGMAKVAWSDVCRPLEEGGQGIRALHPLNKGLMCKHLWDVVLHNSESIWDPWHPFGVLIHQFPWGPRVTGIPLEVQLSVVIQNGAWNWPEIRNIQHRVITDTLSPLGVDRICWSGSNDFTTWEAYHLFQPAGPKDQDRACVLCNRGIAEIHDHLFFQCDYSRQCLQILRSKVRFSLPFRTWRPNVDWAARRWRGRHPLNAASHALLASLVYHIWMEWNQQRFSSKTSTPDQTVMLCIEQIRG
ncbi:UNVERIFIED_CONTAM: hypothetical protein Slati_2157400, partial [Sesamum latifolium]